jgi:serine/threonine protein phosphatase 1
MQGPMSRTYAVPDLHGRYDLLRLAIDRITLHSRGHVTKIVTLGDYVDRGPNSRQIIDFLINWSSSELTLIALKGNHEAMMWQCCRNLSEMSWWLGNGGDQTILSYDRSASGNDDAEVIPPGHLHWIETLPLMFVDQHRVYVHAGVDPTLPLHQQSEQTLLWKRYPATFSKGFGSRHVVHGHDAQSDGPVVTKGKTNLDTWAWKTGRLVVGVFDDDIPGGAVEFLQIMLPQSNLV